MSLLQADHLAVGAMLALLGWAVVTDGRTLIIPNRIPLGIAALYPAWAIAAWPAADPLGAALVAGAVLAAGLAAFVWGLCGGGDAKLLAAVSLWAGPALVLDLMVVTALAGGVLAVSVLLATTLRRRRMAAAGAWPSMAGGPAGDGAGLGDGAILGRPIPYGIAIAFGGAVIGLRLLAL